MNCLHKVFCQGCLSPSECLGKSSLLTGAGHSYHGWALGKRERKQERERIDERGRGRVGSHSRKVKKKKKQMATGGLTGCVDG